MQELIDKEVTLLLLDTAIKQFCENWLQDKLTKNGLLIAKRIVSKQPTVNPEVKQGQWVVRGQDIYCSECNEESLYNPFGASKFSRFCPNCGVEMRVEDDDND